MHPTMCAMILQSKRCGFQYGIGLVFTIRWRDHTCNVTVFSQNECKDIRINQLFRTECTKSCSYWHLNEIRATQNDQTSIIHIPFPQQPINYCVHNNHIKLTQVLISHSLRMPLNNILSIPISPVLETIFLSEPIFTQRFAKVSRVEDPYVRIFDICKDLQSNSRVAVKDYSACTSHQINDVLMNLQSYRGLEQIQGISKLIAFCYNQTKREIIAAFQYHDSTLEELVMQQFFQDNRRQFYLFLLKDLLFVFQSAKNIGIELEDLIPSNILLYQVDNYFRIKILYDQRQKKYDKILEGIKTFCSVQSLEAALGITQAQQYQQNKEFIFELGLLLLDVIYAYEVNSRKNHSKEAGRCFDLNYKGYHVFEDHSRVKLNAYLIIQKKNFLLSLDQPFISAIVDLISLMISPLRERVTLEELFQRSEKLNEQNGGRNRLQSQYSSPQNHEVTTIKQSYSPDSLKYSQQASNHHINKYSGTETTLTLTKNVFMDSNTQVQQRNINNKYNLIPKNKILNEINIHKNIKQQLQKFIAVLQSKSTVVKKQYLDGSIYYGELDTSNHKRQGLGMYFYTHGDVYFGGWKDNILIDGIYIFRNGQCFEGVVKNGKQGWGRYYYLNGNIYEGDWKDDLKEGRGKMSYSNGDVYEGMWVKGKKNGEGVYHYHNGSVYKGNFSNGKKSGFGTIIFSNSTKVEAFWIDNHIEGKGKVFYNNGHYYQGDFQFSEKQGQGIYKWEDDTKYIGEFKKDLMLGEAKIEFLDNEYYEGKVTNGKREGYGIYRYPNGDQFKGQWKNDLKLIGQYKYNDGRIFDGRFKKNEISYGVMVYENGDKYQGQFNNGERQGLGTYTNPKGEILYFGKWVRDTFIEKV